MNIEEITEENISKLTEMVVKLWPECNYEEELDNCLKIRTSENENIFIAKADGDFVGFIQISLRTDHVEGTTTSPVVYVEGLFVEPDYRKKGIARQLVKKAETWGQEKNCSEIASDAELDNTISISFHKSIGFKEANRVVCFSRKIGEQGSMLTGK